ncbi:hypothetical protein GCM10023093_06900 [Nemorincola caseinilytica]|uniref:BIG2 domain-containing protein n=1 Tax=Nemorincola caseinilytica TaxID=2054315 RepID=A0ABP8N9F4_9BACT
MNRLIINTGFDPMAAGGAGAAIAGTVVPNAPNPDPHWEVIAMSPGLSADIAATPGAIAVVPVGAASVIDGPSVGWAVYPGGAGGPGNWIGCLNGPTYDQSTTDANYRWRIRRRFTLSCAARVTFNFVNASADNWIIGGTLNGVPMPIPLTAYCCGGLCCGSTGINMFGGDPGTFDPMMVFTEDLPAGTHDIVFEMMNDQAVPNNIGVAIQGFITTPSPSIVPENMGICVGENCPLPGPILCTGETSILPAPPPAAAGGGWTSHAPGVASVNPVTGQVGGVSPGIAIIEYTLPAGRGCPILTEVTVNAPAIGITGSVPFCQGSTITLSYATGGGTWSSSAPGIASVGPTGIVTGVAGGTATITYHMTPCYAVTTVTVNPSPTPITGTAKVCVTQSTTLSSSPTGGTWSSSNAPVAVVSPTGVVTGIMPGTSVITYMLAGGCYTTKVVTVYALPGVITGIMSVCVGSTTVLSNAVTGGTWSTPPAIPPRVFVNASTGAVTGLLPGTATIIYTAPGGACSTSATVIVDILPPAVVILPVTSIYEGCTYTLTGIPGLVSPGTTVSWTLPTTTTGSALGVPVNTALSSTVSFTAGAPGVIVVRYKLTNACGSRTTTLKFEIMPKPRIKTARSIDMCKDDVTTLSAGPAGGTWTGGDPLVATVTPGGVVTGVGVGSTVFTYTLPLGTAGCTAVGYTVVNVHPAPTPISGSLVICDSGATTTLTNGEPGGTWTSSDPSVASIDPVTGVVTGHSSGTATITYEVPPWRCFKTAVVSVLIGAPACVCSDYVPAGAIFNELDPLHTGTISGIIPSGNYYLNHDITIHTGTAVNLTGCVVVMSPGVKITVNSRAIMEVVHSHLFCCRPNMWQGIVLSTDLSGGGSGSTGQLILTNDKTGSTLVEDARVAVDIPSPQPMPGYTTAGAATNDLTLYASGVTFNRNNRGIRITDAAMPGLPISGPPTTLHPSYPFVVQNAVFTSRDLSVFTGWPYAWPRNDGSILVGALKAPYPAPPTNLYRPPYYLEAYTQVSCNMGGIPTTGIELHDVGTTTGAGIGTYSGVVIGSPSGTPGVAMRNIFDNMRIGILAKNSNLASRNSAYMHMKGTLASVSGTGTGSGIYSYRDNAGALANLKIGLDVYGNASGYRNEFWDCVIGVKAQDLYAIRGMYSYMSSQHTSTVPSGGTQGRAGYAVTASEFFDIQLNDNTIYNIRTGISCQVVPPAVDHSLYVGQITASRNLISANSTLTATMTNNEYVHTGIAVQALIYPYSGGIVPGSQVNTDYNSMAYVYNGIVLTGFDQDHQIKTSRINAILLRPDGMGHLPYQQAGILHANDLRDHIQTNLVMGPGYNVPAPAATYDPALTTTRSILEGIHCNDLNSTYICNNLLRDINTGFYFDGISNLNWIGNMMMNNAYGYVLHGNISPQPLSHYWSMTNDVTANVWNATGGFSWASNWQTYTIGAVDLSNITGSAMYVDPTPVTSLPIYNGSDPGGTPYSTAMGGGIDVATGTTTVPLCDIPDPTTIPIVYRHAGQKKRKVLTGQNWMSQMHTWKAIANNDGTNMSAELYAFKQMAENSRYKYLTDIESDIASGNYEHAKQLLAQPLNYMTSDARDAETNVVLADKAGDNIVSNYKQYYDLLIRYSTDKLNSADSQHLVVLAEKCPLADGAAIYQARALYNLVFDDCRIFSDLGCKLEPQQEIDEAAGATTAVGGQNADDAYKLTQAYTLHPNPSDGNMTLTQKVQDNEPVMAEVWNAAGASIFKGELRFTAGTTDLNIGNISGGMYMLQLIDSKGNRSTLRFVINGR